MALVKQQEKPEMAHISHRLVATDVKRYHGLVEKGRKMRVNIPASYAEVFHNWLDEAETELNGMNVSRLRTATKSEE